MTDASTQALTQTMTQAPTKQKRCISDLPDDALNGRRVMVRCDFNVPVEAGEVVSDHRLRACLPTLEYLLERHAKVIILTHRGRPKGQVDEAFSLQPVFKHLQGLLPKTPMKLIDLPVGDHIAQAIDQAEPGSLLMLENIRFEPGETKNDADLAKKLGAMADVYVNDAFGTSHRAHVSTAGITDYVPIKVAGFLLNRELSRFAQLLDNPPRPFVAIIGGSKISTKIGVLNNLLPVVDQLIVGGGMTYTFLKAQGLGIGNSIVETDQLDVARAAMDQAQALGKTLVIPSDVVVADAFNAEANTQVVPANAIPDGWEGVDTGPDTIAQAIQLIQQAKALVWNGPVGVFEIEPFATGTVTLAQAVAEQTRAGKLISVLGGGDTEAAIATAGLSDDDFTHVSTGGGASLELLEGKVLPGVAVLEDRPDQA